MCGFMVRDYLLLVSSVRPLRVLTSFCAHSDWGYVKLISVFVHMLTRLKGAGIFGERIKIRRNFIFEVKTVAIIPSCQHGPVCLPFATKTRPSLFSYPPYSLPDETCLTRQTKELPSYDQPLNKLAMTMLARKPSYASFRSLHVLSLFALPGCILGFSSA